MYADMDRAIDALPGEIDFDHARGDLLRYLAQWVCVEAGEGEKTFSSFDDAKEYLLSIFG